MNFKCQGVTTGCTKTEKGMTTVGKHRENVNFKNLKSPSLRYMCIVDHL